MFSVYLQIPFSYSLPQTPNPKPSSHPYFIQIQNNIPLFGLKGQVLKLKGSYPINCLAISNSPVFKKVQAGNDFINISIS